VDVKFTMPIIIGTIPFESLEKPLQNQKPIIEKSSYCNSDKPGRSAIASPILATDLEFKYEHPWTSQFSIRSNHAAPTPVPSTLQQIPVIPPFPTLPPLDLARKIDVAILSY